MSKPSLPWDRPSLQSAKTRLYQEDRMHLEFTGAELEKVRVMVKVGLGSTPAEVLRSAVNSYWSRFVPIERQAELLEEHRREIALGKLSDGGLGRFHRPDRYIPALQSQEL